MKKDDLKQFLLYCGREGYANIGDDGQIKEKDGSATIQLSKGDFKKFPNLPFR